jgi:hypothetical protein
MTTGAVKSLQNVWGHGVGLFLCGWEAVENAKMGRMAAQVFGIAMVESQENTCSTLLTSVSYTASTFYMRS